jgi:hypothetical protein
MGVKPKKIDQSLLVRPSHRWDIKMDHSERGCEDGDWIKIAQHRIQWWTIMK